MKTLNIIEAMKMPVGTEFEVVFNGEKIPNNTMRISLELIGSREYKNIDWKSHPEGTYMKPYDFLINGVFIPIQQPVSFMIAVANENNRIKVDLTDLNFIASAKIDLNKYMSIKEMVNALYLNLSDYGISEAIKNGKWYIQE